MEMKTEGAAPPDPLAALAAQADSIGPAPGEGVTELDAHEREAAERAEHEATEAMAKVERAFAHGVFAAARWGRAKIATRVPEILAEWPDPLLQAPASASVPLAKKHLAKLFEVAAKSPETAAFVITLIPLILGAVNAMDAHSRNAKAKGPTDAPQPADGDAAEAA